MNILLKLLLLIVSAFIIFVIWLKTLPEGAIYKQNIIEKPLYEEEPKIENKVIKEEPLSVKKLQEKTDKITHSKVKRPKRHIIKHKKVHKKRKVHKKDSRFKCDGRHYCNQMHSCAEAMYFLKYCPNPKMDGDRDGRPCESQWCR